MTCRGCKTNVESALGNLLEINNFEANLKEETVNVEMTSHVSIEKLQETLLKAGLHYTIEMPGHEKHAAAKIPVDGNYVPLSYLTVANTRYN